MKFLISIACIATLSAGQSFAQQVMDGSDKNVPAAVWENAKQAVTGNLSDPYSAQFDKLRPTVADPASICGRFNAKNQAGGYIGFRPFLFNGASKNLTVNKTNECGNAVVDRDEQNRTMAQCEANTQRINRWTAGERNGVDVAALLEKGKWCQAWMLDQMANQLGDLTEQQ